MQNPLEFYTSELKKQKKKLRLISRKLNFSSSIRLILFVLLIFGIYYFFDQFLYVIGILGLGISLFIVLISRHTSLKNQRDFILELVKINELEIQILNGNFKDLKDGSEFIDPTHFYSFDIDLFGKGSFFQFINRTVTQDGTDELAKNLTSNDIRSISKKQETLKELAKIPNWRQEFSATGSNVKVQYPAKQIVRWINNYKKTLPNLVRNLPKIFGLISLTLIVLVFLNIISYLFLILWFFIGLGIAGFYVKKVNFIYDESGKVSDTFDQYYRLLHKIENSSFHSEILLENQKRIKLENEPASIIFRKFSKILNAFDQRNNVVLALIGNGFFLMDIHNAFKVEQWILSYQGKIGDWFDVIQFFDAQNSLANFVFNHPNYVFPILHSDNNYNINSEQLGHPLLNPEKRVDNNFWIENQQFFIITGANMAGKSTFLRTVSLSIVMANLGLPVCAKSFHYSPIKLITSMRTSDSLVDDESYFFSELKRLKFIVDEIEKDKYFIILDEILKGTNSTDKAIGSRKFVQKLVSTNSTGIIATHDLSLCSIEQELNEVKNYYFDAEIINDELHFDYQLKVGVCKNMNASFLLKKMKIV